MWAVKADLLEEYYLGLIQAKVGPLPKKILCILVCGCAGHDVPSYGLPAHTPTLYFILRKYLRSGQLQPQGAVMAYTTCALTYIQSVIHLLRGQIHSDRCPAANPEWQHRQECC